MNRIRLFDYLSQYEQLKHEILDAVERVLGSGQLILGPEVAQFEYEFAEFLGVGGECVGVGSGTDALIVALRALGVGNGDEVITVSNTAVPTVSAIRTVGAMPVFCDVNEKTCLMDLEQLPSLTTSRTRVVIPVHLYGNVVDVRHIREIIGHRRIYVVEDCAQAHGATLQGRVAGTLGDISAFSFYPTKNLGAYGDGGICWSADPRLTKQMRMIRMYGFDGKYLSEREGINSRLDELQAAILRIKLRYLTNYLKRRQCLAEIYEKNLPNRVNRIMPDQDVKHAYHLFVVKVANRDRVREELNQRGIDTGIHYPYPIHLMRGYAFLGYREGSLPRTEKLAQSILSLPMYPELSDKSVQKVCAELGDILN